MIRFAHRLVILAAVLSFALPASAGVEILEAGEGIEFVNMGIDPATGAIRLVGTDDGVAKVFYVGADCTPSNPAR